MIIVSESDIGKWVIYTNGVGEEQRGRIKSFNDLYVFVVYNCDNDWRNYQNYTAAATRRIDLRFTYEGPK